MSRRRVVLLAGAFGGAAFALRRSGRPRERVDLFYEDGTVVALTDTEAQPLLDIARSIL